jgi:hypothetical protein
VTTALESAASARVLHSGRYVMFRRFPTFVAGLVFGLSLSAGVAVAGSPFDGALRSIRAAADDQGQIRAIALTVRDRYARDQLLVATDQLGRHLGDARDSLRSGPPAPTATSEADFSRILGAMDAQAFGDDKLTVLRDASNARLFTTGQVIRVLDQLPFGDDKVDAAAMLYPRVIDPAEWYRVYPELTFSSEKDDLSRRTSG